MRYFFIHSVKPTDSIFSITGSDAKHIRTVLRLKPGDKIGLFDGRGFEYEAEIIDLSPGKVNASIIRSFPSTAESPVQITVAQGFLKERKMDGIVRQLCELGITKWMPFIAERSVPMPDEKKLLTRKKRWNKIVQEAVKQCRRGCVMTIGEAASFSQVLNLAKDCDFKIAFWEEESRPVQSIKPEGRIRSVFVLIGPEGGFTREEIEKAKDHGFVTAGLGPRILRAETAAVAACALLQYLFGDMGQKYLDKKTGL
ncbi:MAG: 16S rRNA (uracil(1498)-N(3))-methyltransferase [Desulfobacterales bacterium]